MIVICTLSACEVQKTLSEGKGVFEFSGHPALKGQKMRVFYYRPTKGDIHNMPILFVMHGVQRNADDYRDNWAELSEYHNVLVIVPEFSNATFPKSRTYNYGNLRSEDSAMNPEELWSYSLIDPIFDHVVQHTRSKAKQYDIFGHSAGSQFVHRFFLFKQRTKANRVVAANAGTYTMLDFDVDFPYGFKGVEYSEDRLKQALQRKLVVQLGKEDTDPNHHNLNVTPNAMKQGEHRFARGQTFYNEAKAAADRLGVDFNWVIRTVPGAAHDNAKMAVDIAKYLYGR